MPPSMPLEELLMISLEKMEWKVQSTEKLKVWKKMLLSKLLVDSTAKSSHLQFVAN